MSAALLPPAQACRSCDAPIRWVKTTTGKRMPLDADPTDDGTVVVANGVAIVIGTEAVPPDSNRYTSHFATCPDASTWRRK